MKHVKFLEYIFPLKINSTFEQPIDTVRDVMCEDVRRSKRQRKKTSFGDDFYTYLVEPDATNFFGSY